jgi:23S rRNA (guanine745-N1)-methyltransferase
MTASQRNSAERAADGLFVCTVAGCGERLVLGERSFACARGHTFDVAREGYVNLLQPNDRRSLAAGDSAESIDARAGLHERGHLAHVTAALVAAACAHSQPGDALCDLGCGSGHVLAALAAAGRSRLVGFDLSAHAARRAARVASAARIAVANVDRGVPLADASLAAALSVFGPRPTAELARVLAPRGTLIVAVPAPDDLVELRALATGEGRLEERSAAALAALAPAFELESRSAVRAAFDFDAAGLAALSAATYRAARHDQRERVASVSALRVTLAADVLILKRR